MMMMMMTTTTMMMIMMMMMMMMMIMMMIIIIIIIMSVFYNTNFKQRQVAMLKSVYDIRQTPHTSRRPDEMHTIWWNTKSHYEYATLNKVFRVSLKVSKDWAHLMEIRSVFQGEGAACAKGRWPNFTDGIQLIVNILTNFILMIIETTDWIKQDTKVPAWVVPYLVKWVNNQYWRQGLPGGW